VFVSKEANLLLFDVTLLLVAKNMATKRGCVAINGNIEIRGTARKYHNDWKAGNSLNDEIRGAHRGTADDSPSSGTWRRADWYTATDVSKKSLFPSSW